MKNSAKKIDWRFVLCHTSHSGNIGSAARAMKVMGFDDLRLVDPQANPMDEQAIALASSADDVLQKARQHPDLLSAIADCHYAFAMTARPRYFSPKVVGLWDVATVFENDVLAPNDDNSSLCCAVVLGNERAGLSNEDVMLCSHLMYIPSNPEYSSLNLAQAVQVVAYELRRSFAAVGNAYHQESHQDAYMGEVKSHQAQSVLATREEVEGMHRHLLQALEAIHFYQPYTQPTLLQRLQQVWHRAHLSKEEVAIFRGMASKILYGVRKF